MIGVVIPLYNHREFIAEAIGSVLSQTRPVSQVIVIDDGSQDGSMDVVRGIQDSRIVLREQENAGAHAAINRGIREAADCEYIAILNSDDVYHPARIEQCAGFLESHPDVDVVCSKLRLIDRQGRGVEGDAKSRWIGAAWSADAAGADLAWWLGIANFAKTSSNFVARREYLLANPFRAYRYVHDYFFAAVCALDHKLGLVPEELLLYRMHDTNTIKSTSRDNVTKEILRMNLDLLREIAPRLARQQDARRDYALYLRSLLENHSDFRPELFVYILAGLAEQCEPDAVAALFDAMDPAAFPELCQPASRSPWERRAEAEYARLQRALLASRWFALGRTLGLIRDLSAQDGANSEAKLSTFKRRVAGSRWLRIGRKLGMNPIKA